MSESSRAVFLSYASEDAEAARLICEALRSAGIEVWFDTDGGLEHGDEWDAKIRRQIKECVLFLPVISVHTQARHEGYFRIEWDLAAERARGIASGVPFLLPVVIDDTREPDALVPDRFRLVQWTRLPGGEMPTAVLQRYLKLWSHRTGTMKHEGVRDSASAPGSPIPASSKGESHPLASRAVRRLLLAAALVILAGGAWWLGRRPPPPSAAPTVASKGPSAVLSRARQLVEKARVLYEPWDLATKDDLVMAEQFLKRAAELNPTDGEVWAAQALLSCAFVGMSVTPEDRRAEMRLQAERAVKLAPHSDNARFALGYATRLQRTEGSSEKAEPILREVVARNPENRLMLRCLGVSLANRPETHAEGLAILQRVAAMPGGDAVAEFNLGQAYMSGSRNLKEALAAYNRSLKLAPSAHRTHSAKIELLLRFAGDLPAARQALREVPEAALREDRVAALAVRALLASGEPDEALRILRSSYPYIATGFFTGPTSYLKGLAHQQANRLSAAASEWNIALKEIQRRLDANPTARGDLGMKATVLACLGRQPEAIEALTLYEQVSGPTARSDLRALTVKTHLGRIPEVVAGFEERLQTGRSLTTTAMTILFNPEFAPLRSHPGYSALAEKARAVYADQQTR